MLTLIGLNTQHKYQMAYCGITREKVQLVEDVTMKLRHMKIQGRPSTQLRTLRVTMVRLTSAMIAFTVIDFT